MTLSLLVNTDLRPCVEKLLPLCPHTIQLHFLSKDLYEARRQIRHALAQSEGFDAVVLLDGLDLLPSAPWENGAAPLVIPRVHDAAALLLGAVTYRALFDRYDGGICWMLPGMTHPFFTTPEEDCQVLCHIVDLQLSIPDTEPEARSVCRYHNFDYIRAAGDCSLLESLLGGGHDLQDAVVFAPYSMVSSSD